LKFIMLCDTVKKTTKSALAELLEILKIACGELPMPLGTVKQVRRTLATLYSTCI
jgi:hypothetical protein